VIEQAFIAITELIAVGLLQAKTRQYKKWASIFGLLGQPFWFYTSYQQEQWGVFLVCFCFLALWIKSFANNWIKPEQGFTPEDYYELINDALDKVENKTQIDYKDYIRRVTREALKIK
jgi:hypothetical protein